MSFQPSWSYFVAGACKLRKLNDFAPTWSRRNVPDEHVSLSDRGRVGLDLKGLHLNRLLKSPHESRTGLFCPVMFKPGRQASAARSKSLLHQAQRATPARTRNAQRHDGEAGVKCREGETAGPLRFAPHEQNFHGTSVLLGRGSGDSCGIPHLAKNERDMGHPLIGRRDRV